MLASQREEAITHEKYTKRNVVTQHLLRLFEENEELIKSVLPLLGYNERNNFQRMLPKFGSKFEKEEFINNSLRQLK